ncbi:UNVERIFIED_CONTAM: hypothetical protein PYX00_004829 [Menopon gallinae]|uniref:GTP-binding protein 10 n=1 Tax=Menopon gallinae TaxID=328185 RepID=A0AAW2I6V0_9NEOP
MTRARSVGKAFIDSIRIRVKAGCGGHGLRKYGGIGGNGGDVCLEAGKFTGLNSFLSVYPHKNICAESGKDSKKGCILGVKGEDKTVKVPVGITVYDENNKKIGELNEIGEKLIVAKGGGGGSPATQFTGMLGEEKIITLDLKLIADVGLVGFPNAGKSTLLKSISRADPKIASYPFTTLKPNLGVLKYDDLRQITMADLPGLIEGASMNIGMGHKFLKHVERTSVLLMVVDIDGFQYAPHLPHRSCIETIILLNKELELYDKMLLKKPILLAINKMDKTGAQDKLQDVLSNLGNLKSYVEENIDLDLRPETLLKFNNVVPISARYNKDSVFELKDAVRSVLDEDYFKKSKGSLKQKAENLMRELDKKSVEVGKLYT